MVLLTSILLPLYMYPKPGDWNWATKAITAYPFVNFDIIINPHSGPGPINTFPDPNYITAIAALNAFDNTNLLGYVDTNYMHRETRDVVAEVDTCNYSISLQTIQLISTSDSNSNSNEPYPPPPNIKANFPFPFP
ncbi:hypothetical protein EYC80_000737 [Monilinia laxa]|uniref:Uncharacterized protein n=1 Tax=Monilinia laxa TaxID=61186 RepID=A0A5N6K708_MONLA|nr:hypothetical protein EYC80_000737 [Monilinia laxa]